MSELKNMEFEILDGIECLDTFSQDENIPTVIVIPPNKTFSSINNSLHQVNFEILSSSDESSINLEYCEIAKKIQGGRSRKKGNTRQKK